MHVISIYNNKGGAGKSTLTVLMADFLAATRVRNRPMRVLVVDLDAQGSSSTALLGQPAVCDARGGGFTIGHLAQGLDAAPPAELERYFIPRSTAKPAGRARPLPELRVMVPEKQSIFDFEANPLHRSVLLKKRLKPILKNRFDLVLVDLPGNIDQRNLLAVNALVMSDSVVIPVEPSRFSMNAMPDTLNMIQYARSKNSGGEPVFLGMVLNRADKRTNPFKRHGHRAREIAREIDSPWFENHLPNAPVLATATDDGLTFHTLRERYGNHYHPVRKVVLELFHRWQRLAGDGR